MAQVAAEQFSEMEGDVLAFSTPETQGFQTPYPRMPLKHVDTTTLDITVMWDQYEASIRDRVIAHADIQF